MDCETSDDLSCTIHIMTTS